MSVRVSVEGKRGCGYRKPGGLYLVGPELMEPCGRLPIPLTVCPHCGAGIRPARGWTWVDPEAMAPAEPHGSPEHNSVCPFGRNAERGELGHRCGERAGLIWVGGGFYTADEFVREAGEMGISRRITGVPRGFEIGETWVLLAHREALVIGYQERDGVTVYASLQEAVDAGVEAEPLRGAGLLTAFRPTAVEYVCRDQDLEDEDFLETLRKRGIESVQVVRAEEQVPLAGEEAA